MEALNRLVFGLGVVSVGLGVLGSQSLAWAGQATEHDHTHAADAAAAPAAPQTPAPPAAPQMSGMQMSGMSKDMMARMSALDAQFKALGAELNAATTTDAKVTAMAKLMNLFIEQRSMMRMQMEMQGKMMEQMMSMHQMMQGMMSASPGGATTQPNGNDKH